MRLHLFWPRRTLVADIAFFGPKAGLAITEPGTIQEWVTVIGKWKQNLKD